MDKSQVKSKVLEYLDKNYNLSLYSQSNRRFLAEQISVIFSGGEAKNTADALYSGDTNKKLESGDEFNLGGGILKDYSREHQSKIDQEKFVESQKKLMKEKEDKQKSTEKSNSNPSKKQLKKLSKTKVGQSK